MSSSQSNERGFSTFTGVFVPNVTMMFGVILFMRLGLVLGNLGFGQFLLVIGVSLSIMMITSFSIASIVSNMKVGTGGAYYLISRSLGIEIGGACGLALVLAQLFTLTLVISGFGYSFKSLYPDLPTREIEIITMFVLLLLSIFSAKLALRTQTLIFFLLLASIGSLFFSAFQTDITNLSISNASIGKMGFWEGFAIFYPALTGIEAGMALSGNLKNPSRSLAYGNIYSLLVVAGVYTAVAFVLWLCYPLEVLKTQPLLLLTDSKIPFLVYLGIWCATLSSALGNLLGAPRMLQMISEDGIVPPIFSRVYGAYREPRWAIAIIFFVAMGFILFTTIDQVIPILSMICLLTYGILNLVACIAELIHNVSWRPKIPCPWQVSALGAFACFFLMLMIDPVWSIISIFIVTGVYIFLRSRGLEAPFNDLRDNIIFFFSRIALYRLSSSEEHPTNWQPQIIVFWRTPMQQEQMIETAHAMTSRSGILTVVTIVPEFWNDPDQLEGMKNRILDWLGEKSIECLLEVKDYPSFYEGVENLIKIYGIGPLQPNTVMLPVSEMIEEELDDFINVIEVTKTCAKNLILYFNPEEVKESIDSCDLWWDSENRESFELSLSYLLSLRRSEYWYPENILLRAVVPDTRAEEHLSAHFTNLFHTTRIQAKPKIEITEEEDFFENIRKYSSDTDMIILPLRSISEFENRNEFKEYLKHSWNKLPKNIPILCLTSYDMLNHKEVYIPEEEKE